MLDMPSKLSADYEYDTIRGRWWAFENGRAVRALTDYEAAWVIWGFGTEKETA